MKFGVAIFPTESVQPPGEIAVMAEERGFECLLLPEHTPVLVGGNGPRVLDRVLAYGDEWMPNRSTEEELVARIGELESRAAEIGRARIPVTVMGMATDAARIDRLGQGGSRPRGVLVASREPGYGRAGIRPLRGGDGAVPDGGVNQAQPR
jgi:alkanesulfonate monooxygenase SsuD/methylene tetrahydromethanopterin reductase-like flavin-dependent oxidoreductase (luciferase family)